MALKKEQKQEILKDLKEIISKQKSVIFVDFSKVKSQDLFSLRKRLKEAGCMLKIGKKTLVRIAFGQSGISVWDRIKKSVPGQLALVFGIEDELSPAKISNQFTKTNENLKILGGIFENRFVGREEVLVLANLPSRNELLKKMLGSISAPVSGFMNVLQGNIKGLTVVLSKIKK